MPDTEKTTRPTKKQHQTLEFIREFIEKHGYSPSYREIMKGCNYTSVATVALHVNNLIKRGHIIKRDKSARSLEVVSGVKEKSTAKVSQKPEIIKEIESRFEHLEKEVVQEILDEIYVLVGALKILGHPQEVKVYSDKIRAIKDS